MLVTGDEVGVDHVELGEDAAFAGIEAGLVRPRCDPLAHELFQPVPDPRENGLVQ